MIEGALILIGFAGTTMFLWCGALLAERARREDYPRPMAEYRRGDR